MGDGKWELVERLRSMEGWEVREQRVLGSRVWQVRRRGGERPVISVWVLVKQGKTWHAEVQDEGPGLEVVDCPVDFLEMAREPEGGSAGWRERVRQAAAQAALGREWAAGVLREAREGDLLYLKPGLEPAWVRVTGAGGAGSLFGDGPNGVRTRVGWRQFGRLEPGERRGARVAPVYDVRGDA